ncbi:hypothetical protein GIB67_014569, partial [Kingdonia uniflora]
MIFCFASSSTTCLLSNKNYSSPSASFVLHLTIFLLCVVYNICISGNIYLGLYQAGPKIRNIYYRKSEMRKKEFS